MEFTQRKLPRSDAGKLKRSSIDSIKPFALLLTQVYVFMKRNSKFLAVKGPLDFFTQEELERMRPFGTLFLPDFVQVALPFRDAAKSVRLTLSWRPRLSHAADENGTVTYPEVALPPAPYELSDAVLKIIGPLWGAGGVIEPYFVTVFSHEVCDALPPAWMKKLRDADHLRFEDSLFVSSWAVFLALHLGRCDLGYLSRFRAQVFAAAFPEVPSEVDLGKMDADSQELLEIARQTFVDPTAPLKIDTFDDRPERVAQMIAGRFRRVLTEFIRKDRIAPTVFGEKGLIIASDR